MALIITEVPLDRILTDETRRTPDERLIRSMAQFGLFMAIELRAQPDGRYQLEDGSRRFGAAQELGWKSIRALVTPAGEAGCPRDLKAILVNTQRQNLQQLDIARHARRLMREGGYSQAELARQIQMGESTLSQMLKVVESPELVSAIEGVGLQFGAAKALTALSSLERRQMLAEFREIAARDGKFPSVRQVEERVRLRQGHAPLPEVSPAGLVPAIEALQLQDFPMEIKVTRGKQSQLKVTLVLAEKDQEWVNACLIEG
jgi:ParB family chromosome partitioning protein